MPPKKKTSALDELLARITVEDAPEDQTETTTLTVENGAAVVRVKPDKVTPKARRAATLDAAAQLVLAGYGDYNGVIRRTYGAFEGEERAFKQAQASATATLVGLLDLLVPEEAEAPASA